MPCRAPLAIKRLNGHVTYISVSYKQKKTLLLTTKCYFINCVLIYMFLNVWKDFYMPKIFFSCCASEGERHKRRRKKQYAKCIFSPALMFMHIFYFYYLCHTFCVFILIYYHKSALEGISISCTFMKNSVYFLFNNVFNNVFIYLCHLIK